jgi:hypothetical protein
MAWGSERRRFGMWNSGGLEKEEDVGAKNYGRDWIGLVLRKLKKVLLAWQGGRRR